jgi:murein DD-endopeptidase MepM/ murein hydrolase activator NlpD
MVVDAVAFFAGMCRTLSYKAIILTQQKPEGTVRAASDVGCRVKPYSTGISHDFKETSGPTIDKRSRRWLLFCIGLSLPLLTVALFFLSQSEAPPPPTQSMTVGPTHESTLPLPEPGESAPDTVTYSDTAADETESLADQRGAVLDQTAAILNLLVQRGDTLEILFRRNGLSLADLADLVALPGAGSGLKLLRPGDRLEIAHREGEVLSLQRELDEVKVLTIARSSSGFEASTYERAVDVRTAGAHGVIRSSLFEAGMEAGISDRVTMDMAGIFEWDIDFIQDVREGDEFTVVYEELWRDGVKVRNGNIVAAEFINQGKSYRAARYRDETGHIDYFTPDGRSVRKAFIRAPLNFTRISSNFNPSRRHPVLNTIRAHRGVDYAAPTGTPIRAAGDGKVTFRGTQGGYGNVVIVQHGGNITTLYGHMSKFSNARVGSRVRQGDVIGYVGKSGLATGPHLHYEYRVNGVHRNPRTVALPPADPVPAQYTDDFRASTASLWRQLDLYRVPTAAVAAD